MPKYVWKYSLPVQDNVVSVTMPKGAKIVHVGVQFDGHLNLISFWAEVDVVANGITEVRYFYTVGTGHPLIPQPSTYLGTVIVADGALVWHLYEYIKESNG